MPHAKTIHSIYRELACANIFSVIIGKEGYFLDRSNLKLSYREISRSDFTFRSLLVQNLRGDGRKKEKKKKREVRVLSRKQETERERRIVKFVRRYTYTTGKQDRMKERENKRTYIRTKMDRWTDAHIDRVTYVAGDEVTEFAVIPLNLRQVHFWYSIFEFR